MKKTRRKIDAAQKAKIALDAPREQCADLASNTRSIQTRYAPGRSRFRSRRRGCSTLVSGEMPRTSGSGRSISYTLIGQLTVERV
jgi:hypothetical protein